MTLVYALFICCRSISIEYWRFSRTDSQPVFRTKQKRNLISALLINKWKFAMNQAKFKTEKCCLFINYK